VGIVSRRDLERAAAVEHLRAGAGHRVA
jgi:hypothetical protein